METLSESTEIIVSRQQIVINNDNKPSFSPPLSPLTQSKSMLNEAVNIHNEHDNTTWNFKNDCENNTGNQNSNNNENDTNSRCIGENQNKVSSNNHSNTNDEPVTKLKHRRFRSETPSLPGNFGHRVSSSKQSNQQLLDELSQNLNDNQLQQIQKITNEFRYERDLKHALIKLQEKEDQLHTAVEIIGKLEMTNEDLRLQVETLTAQFSAINTETKILEEKYQTLTEIYQQEKKEYELNSQQQVDKIQELQQDIHTKQIQLQDFAEHIKNHDSPHGNNQHVNEDFYLNPDGTSNERKAKISNNVDIHQLLSQVQEEKNKIFEKDAKIETLLSQLEDYNYLKHENAQLQDELKSFQEVVEQDLSNWTLEKKAIEKEIIALASRNSALEKEKDDLNILIEQRDYEILQLKSHLEFTIGGNGASGNNGSNSGNDMNGGAQKIPNNSNLFEFRHDHMEYSIVNDNGNNDYIYELHGDIDNVINDDHNILNEKCFSPSKKPLMDLNNEKCFSPSKKPLIDLNNEKCFSPSKKIPLIDLKESSINNKTINITKNIPDVIKEYLHLTASAVKIKFPQIDTITSEQLIQQVQDFPFSDYYDHMIRIMQNEQAKIDLEENKKNKTRKHQFLHPYNSEQHPHQFSSRQFIQKFRLFFSTKYQHKSSKNINLNSSIRNYFLNKRKSSKKLDNRNNHTDSKDSTSSNSVIEQNEMNSKSPQRTPETPKTLESPKTSQTMKASESPNTPPTPSSSNPNNEMSNSFHKIDANSNDNDCIE